MGGHLETVDVKPGAGSESWGNPGDCQHGTSGIGSWWWGQPGDCGHMTQSAVSGEEADSGDCGCMTSVYGLGGGHHGYCRHLTPGIGPGRGSQWRLWPCDSSTGSGEGCHPADCGRVTPDATFEGGHPEDCGHVTLDAGSGRGSLWRMRTCEPSTGSWMQDNPGDYVCDHKCRVWGVGLPWGLWMCDSKCSI